MASPQVSGAAALNGAAPPPAPATPPDEMAQALAVLNGDPQPAPAPAEAPAETPPVPVPPAEVPPQTPEELSAGWAKLTSRERRHKERVAKDTTERATRVAEFEAKEKALAARETELEARVQKAKKSPLGALEEIGWTVDQLTKYVAENGQVPPEKLMADWRSEHQAELEKLKKDQEEFRKTTESEKTAAATARRQREAEAYEAGAVQRVGEMALAEPAKYPSLSRAWNSGKAWQDRVATRALAIQVSHYETNEQAIESGNAKPLALSDAMLHAERELAEILALANPGGAPGQAGTVEPGKPGAVKPEAPPISLSDSSSRTVVAPKSDDDLSDDERWEKAKRELEGR